MHIYFLIQYILFLKLHQSRTVTVKYQFRAAPLKCLNHSNWKKNKIFLKTFEIEVFTFECSNGPVCYLVGSFRVSLCQDIFQPGLTRVAKRDDGRACSLFSFIFRSFWGVKNSILKEKVGSSSPSACSQFSMFGVNCHWSLNQLKSQSKKIAEKYFFLRD